jgi:SAM-dependent methyltransferase
MTAAMYLLAEGPRRLLRHTLCTCYGVSRWHVASSINKPYVMDVVAYLDARRPSTVVEIGCGFCDILSHLQAARRIGFDADRNVVRAARVYTRLKGAKVELAPLDFIRDALPAVRADAWVLINWLHEFTEDAVRPRLRELFGRLDPGGLIVLDTAVGAGYQHQHNVGRLFNGLPCAISVISQDPADSRTVYSVVKTA